MVVIESCCFLLFSLAALCGSSRSSFVIILRDIAIDVLVTQLCLHALSLKTKTEAMDDPPLSVLSNPHRAAKDSCSCTTVF